MDTEPAEATVVVMAVDIESTSALVVDLLEIVLAVVPL